MSGTKDDIDDELFFDLEDEPLEEEEDREEGNNTAAPAVAHTIETSHLKPIIDLHVIVPPMNFAMVEPGIYRSGYPNRKNFNFLLKLGIKSVLYVGGGEYVNENARFLNENGIKLFQCPTDGNEEPFISIPFELFQEALNHLLDIRNYPILIHCFKGKHQTGCLVGCLRKLQRWGLMSIFEEYKRFSPKPKPLDLQFIELFQPQILRDRNLPDWITTGDNKD
jgi:tyrosine-protein phosphatase SIW14